MQPNIYKIDEDKLPIKYVLGIEQQFPEIYTALDYLMDNHQKNIEQKERSQIGFSK